MFFNFLYELKKQGLPASLHEYLNLMEALEQKVIANSVDEFYALSKAIFVKAENQLDTFDKVFDAWFKQGMSLPASFYNQKIPNEWLENLFNKITDKQKAKIEQFDYDELMKRFKDLLKEQEKKHQGGNKWIGAGGVSPFGAHGYHPKGHRLGEQSAGNRTAVKVWSKRQYKNLRDDVELDTRNIKVALKYLRHFTREGLPTELNLDGTIQKTSKNAGMLDIVMQPNKKNKVKVIMLMDVGGSMDDHVALCEKIFSASKTEFKHLKFYYFHNCVYEHVWEDNNLRWNKRIPTLKLTHLYNKEYKLIFVGDAAMAPYELYYTRGAIDHNNEMPGIQWLKMLTTHFKYNMWLNPTPETNWAFYETVGIIRKFMDNRMFPATIDGLVKGMQCLKNNKRTYIKDIWGRSNK